MESKFTERTAEGSQAVTRAQQKYIIINLIEKTKLWVL